MRVVQVPRWWGCCNYNRLWRWWFELGTGLGVQIWAGGIEDGEDE